MLPSDLLRAAEGGRLMVLAGAGISKDAPSNLPDWWGFNRAILEEIIRLAREAVPGSGNALSTLQTATIPVAAFSETIVRSFAGDSYFPILRVLESDSPNRNHNALAELARRGILAAIFTTNFDTLIEQAFRTIGVELRLFVDRADFTGTTVAPPCALFKVHGSVKQTSTLIDTVSQKLRGLPPWVRHALAGLDPSFALLVIGFSGTDLEFNDDYLPLLGNGRFVTWIVNPDRDPSAAVAAKLREIGGVIVKAKLSEIFAELGVEQASPPSTGAIVHTDNKARALVAEWLQLPHIGAWTCAAFCAELLHDIGRGDAAEAIAGELAALLRDRNELPLTAGKVCRVLGRLATEARDFDTALQWYGRELALYATLDRMFATAELVPSPETRREQLMNSTSALVNMAVVRRAKGELAESEMLLRTALPRAVELASPHLVSRIEINLAELADEGEKALDDVLGHARNAAVHAYADGHVQAIIEAHCTAAAPLLAMGEYAAAQKELDRAAAVLGVSSQVAYTIECARLRGELAARRGDDAQASHQFETASNACGTATQRFAVATTAVEALAHTADGRAWLRTFINDLEQQLVGDESRLDLLRNMRELLAEPPDQPLFLLRMNRQMVRPDLRRALVDSEYRKDVPQTARILAMLLRENAIYAQPQRKRDLALALLESARAIGDRDLEWEAWNGLGVALDMIGELSEAAEAYRHAIALASTELDAARSRMNLAIIVSRGGSAAAAESLFEEARGPLEQSPGDDRTRLFMNRARHRARHRMDGALDLALAAREAATEVEHPRAMATCDALIAEIRAMNAPASAPSPGASAPDLANAGIKEMLKGNLPTARDLIGRAKAIYESAGDVIGMSKCLNNLADCAHGEGQLAEAIELSRKALQIRRWTGDIDGEALTRGTLAAWLVEKREPQQAFEEAERALLLLKGRPPTRANAMAAYALAMAQALLGRGIEARHTARDAETWIAACDDRSLQPVLQMLAPLLKEVRPPEMSPRSSPKSEVAEMIREAARLNRTRDFAKALALLAGAEAHPDATYSDRATIAGDRANVLQSWGRDVEAAAAYAIAAQQFRSCDRVAQAQQAICQGAVSLRRAGELAKSAEWLRALLAESPEETIAVQARLALTKTIMMPFFAREESPEPSDPRIIEAEMLMHHSLEGTLDDSNLGHALLTNAQIHIVAGRAKQAVSDLEKARAAFLRINSPHVEAVETQLAQLGPSKGAG